MTIEIKTINDAGLAEIATWLLGNHNEGDDIANDPSCLSAWAAEAEESMGNGNPPMLEIRASDSVKGVPCTYTVTDAGVDTDNDTRFEKFE